MSRPALYVRHPGFCLLLLFNIVMKTLYLIRHAKSSWSYRQLDDFDRPLNDRGRRDVVRMGNYLASRIPPPALMVASTASRALYTSLFLADAWGIPEERVHLEPTLYHADEEEILEVVREYGRGEILALTGHNPGMTGLANELCGKWTENIPTCGVMGINFDIDHWEQIGERKGVQSFFYFPKNIVK